MRKTSTPAFSSARNISGEREAGPMVATILVLRIYHVTVFMLRDFDAHYLLHSRSAVAQLGVVADAVHVQDHVSASIDLEGGLEFRLPRQFVVAIGIARM